LGSDSKSRYFGEENGIYTDNQTTITAASLPETKRKLYQTARYHVPLVGKLYNNRYEKLKSNNKKYKLDVCLSVHRCICVEKKNQLDVTVWFIAPRATH